MHCITLYSVVPMLDEKCMETFELCDHQCEYHYTLADE